MVRYINIPTAWNKIYCTLENGISKLEKCTSSLCLDKACYKNIWTKNLLGLVLSVHTAKNIICLLLLFVFYKICYKKVIFMDINLKFAFVTKSLAPSLGDA